MADIRKINVPELGKLKAFSHATRAGGFIFVSGTLGTKAGSFELVPGGAKAETRQTILNIQSILRGAGAELADVVKVNVFVTDMAKFGEMNEAYLEFFQYTNVGRSAALLIVLWAITYALSNLFIKHWLKLRERAHGPS